MANRSHVPKFGNWDGDNIPYTTCFENARKEKAGGIRINPNDPEENPEAFNFGGHPVGGSISNRPHNGREMYVPQKSSSSHNRVASQSGSDKSRSDNSTSVEVRPNHERKRSDRTKYMTRSQVPPSPGHNTLSYTEDFSGRSASVPKFGEWDEKDPRSAEGFTVIFNKVKEEKHIAASKFPNVPLQNIKQNQSSEKKTRSKKYWCLC